VQLELRPQLTERPLAADRLDRRFVKRLARLADVARQRGISGETALRLGRYFETTSDY
jgi:plasmid maintenance system antidote protein VapI